MRAYRFLTTWLLASEREPVWELIYDAERWPEWWRGVESVVELEPGDAHKVGSLSRHVWRSRLPYRVRFESRTTRVDRPHLIEGRADGELRGEGRWRLLEGPGPTTAVLYEWNVSTTATWMNLLAPVAQSVFESNHDWVMRRGGEGAARRLGVPLLAAG